MFFIYIFLLTAFQYGKTAWTNHDITGPGGRYVNNLVFDGDGLLLFGGKSNLNDGTNDLWRWNNDKWDSLSAGATARWDHGIAFMQKQEKLVIFGGREMAIEGGAKVRSELGDTWLYDGQYWNELKVPGPESRSSFAMSYDLAADEIILFGGRSGDVLFNDTWTFDGSIWNKLDVLGPTPRYGHSICYDGLLQTTYLFGGFDGTELLGDLWAFKDSQWTEIKLEGMPEARMAHAMQFNDKGAAVLFGGYTEGGVSNEYWIFSENSWEKPETNTIPNGRLSHALGFHRKSKSYVLFGGSSQFGSGFFNETWTLYSVE